MAKYLISCSPILAQHGLNSGIYKLYSKSECDHYNYIYAYICIYIYICQAYSSRSRNLESFSSMTDFFIYNKSHSTMTLMMGIEHITRQVKSKLFMITASVWVIIKSPIVTLLEIYKIIILICIYAIPTFICGQKWHSTISEYLQSGGNTRTILSVV